MFQRVPNTVEVRCIVDHLDQEYVTSFYARCTTGYNDGDVQDVLDAVVSSFTADWMIHLCSDYVFDRAEVRDLNTEFGYTATTEVNVAGTQAPPSAPPQLAVLVKIQGSPGGAPRQGRHFISGVKQSVYNATTGLWDQSIVDSLEVAESEMNDAISGAGTLLDFARVLVSRTLNKNLRAEAVTNTIAAFQGRTLPGSQRDRRPTIGS